LTIAVVAEKPSVARDIAAVLGATKRGEGCFEGGGYTVTWAIGHLVALAQPHDINPNWKHWSLATLPMLPENFPLAVLPDTKAQFAIVRRILRDRTIESVVCATDAGREGELIFRYIFEAAACKKPVQRLWISSLTPDAIRTGFRRLKSSAEYDTLADAARGRSRADWLVGMNLSRAYSLTLNQDISVGRVQTPTLAIVAERELEIRKFVPKDYIEVVATFGPSDSDRNKTAANYAGTWFNTTSPASHSSNTSSNPRRLPPDGIAAAAIIERARSGKAAVESVATEAHRLAPPLLYDLTELQRHANRLFSMSAQQTLNTAQSLYERHKLLSYPRTDSRHLSKDTAATLEAVTKTLRHRYAGQIAPGTGTKPLGRRFVDDARVTDHHAIIPTTTAASDGKLSADELRIYDLVCRRLLEAWHDDFQYSTTTVVSAITARGPNPVVDQYESRGTVVDHVGWKVLDLGGGKKAPRATAKSKELALGDSEDDTDDTEQSLPTGLICGRPLRVLDVHPLAKRTRPPKHHTEATLLSAMENAGQTLDNEELSEAMKDLGLGTPATRAQIIETLLRREYLVRRGKQLEATEKGLGLISVIHSEVKSPAMTGEWEAKLKRLQRGQGDLASFMTSIETYVSDVVARVAKGQLESSAEWAKLAPARRSPEESIVSTPATVSALTSARKSRGKAARSSLSELSVSSEPVDSGSGKLETRPLRPPVQRSPTESRDLRRLLQSHFGFSNFRPYQETVCRAATEGHDVLLVMPTGAGKSLCYQLPGIARAGTTLVVSPLIALMDDQAAKLAAQGFRVERIHSGRARADSRQACIDYLAGHLDFLFIAPERLRVPGFPEMLAKRPPALIAIDEAHCISEWGHDFRPDYRLLGQRLPQLRPTPIIALTATATPEVQDDIAVQLGLSRAARFIHGFRRTNIAIEVVEMNPGERAETICQLLADKARRPAIVYAATRKSAEDLGAALGKRLAAVYHAGIDPDDRERIQIAFIEGRLEVIVATVAFGMGIDKANVRTVIHAALPGSLEGYYQEIGRAGRDGGSASALLLHSYADRKTHEFFHDRDYPEPEVLESIYEALSKKPVVRDKLRRKLHLDSDLFDKAIEKLEIHGGAVQSADGEFSKGAGAWLGLYVAQRERKFEQLQRMIRFAQSHDCRMVHMIRHFGDQEDTLAPCGLCDVCATGSSAARRVREPNRSEVEAMSRILATLKQGDDQAVGKLYRETFHDSKLSRQTFEYILTGLRRAGLVDVSEASFEKVGREIRYQRVTLTDLGRQQVASPTGITLPAAAAKAPKKPRSKSAKVSAKPRSKARSKVKAPNKWFFVNRAKRAKKKTS